MWYDVGTVSVTNGSTTVTGAGTDFISGVQVGEGLYIGGDLYEIGVVNSSTQLTLSDAYLGSTATGQAYKIIPTQSLVADLSSGVADLISDFADVRDYAGNGKFNDGTQASPAITFTQDQNNGLYRIGSDNWGMSAGGQKQVDISTTDVELNYSGSKKLATTSTGVDVTGTITADGLKIANSTYITQNDGISSNPRILGMNSSGTTYIGPIDSYRGGSIFYGASANVSNQFFYTGGNQTMRLIQGGDVHFYEDTGTTAKMVWDASAERLGIGTTAPFTTLALPFGAGIGIGDASINTTVSRSAVFPRVTTIADSYNNASSRIDFTMRAGATEENTPLSILASGNVGIGTASPNAKLNIVSNTASAGDFSGSLRVKNESYTTGTYAGVLFDTGDTINSYITSIRTPSFGGALSFGTNSGATANSLVERMRIDSAGNVGIGTASPDVLLEVVGADPVLTIRDTETAGSLTNATLRLAETGAGDALNNHWDISHTGGSALAFKSALGTTASEERARIDSSGNLLVGTTSTTVGYDSADSGIALRGQSGSLFSRSNSFAISANRNGTDGDIVEFRKDGTGIGSIGVDNTDNLYITGTATNHGGVMFGTNEMIPYQNDAITDGAVNIGQSAYRFKDLYLSGGVYLGGTGAVNKLDDYEEGEFTPTFNGSGLSITYDAQAGYYVKVGNAVHFRIQLGTDSVSGGSPTVNLSITGLPFSPSNSRSTSGSIGLFYGTNEDVSKAVWLTSTSSLTLYSNETTLSFDNIHTDALAVGSNKNRLFVSGTYFID